MNGMTVEQAISLLLHVSDEEQVAFVRNAIKIVTARVAELEVHETRTEWGAFNPVRTGVVVPLGVDESMARLQAERTGWMVARRDVRTGPWTAAS